MILEILVYPDPRLRQKAQPVQVVDDSIRQLIDNMFETMYLAEGIGLAATQVNIHKRVVVMDFSPEKDQPMVFINPEITVCGDGFRDFSEGCLSVPGYDGMVSRPDEVLIRALDYKGKAFEMPAQGLLAVCVQHEIDHLEGKVFVDYLSRLKQEKIRLELRGKKMTAQEIAKIRQEHPKIYADQIA